MIARIDANIKALIAASTERQQAYTRLLSIPSVGSVVGSGVLVHLERLPFPDADAFVAFTGLDPRPDDSGHHHGRRRLSKRGPSELRRLLYLAAMSAAHTKVWKPLYQHYLAQGLPTTAALVILARRIARTAWSIYTHKTTFDAERLTKHLRRAALRGLLDMNIPRPRPCYGFFLANRPRVQHPPSGAEAMGPERDSAQPRRGEPVGSRPGRASPGRSTVELPYPGEGMADVKI